jgi:hypothetical protein
MKKTSFEMRLEIGSAIVRLFRRKSGVRCMIRVDDPGPFLVAEPRYSMVPNMYERRCVFDNCSLCLVPNLVEMASVKPELRR